MPTFWGFLLVAIRGWWRLWVFYAERDAPADSRPSFQFWIKWVEDSWEILLFLLEWIPVMLLTSTAAINTHKARFAKPMLPNGGVSLYHRIAKTSLNFFFLVSLLSLSPCPHSDGATSAYAHSALFSHLFASVSAGLSWHSPVDTVRLQFCSGNYPSHTDTLLATSLGNNWILVNFKE